MLPLIGGSFALSPEPGSLEGMLAEDLDRMADVARASGRIEISSKRILNVLGNAFLVGPDLVITTGHICDAFAEQDAGGAGIKDGFSVSVKFAGEDVPETAMPVVRVVLRHPVLDIAILEIDSAGQDLPPPVVMDGSDRIETGDAVAMLTFVQNDPRLLEAEKEAGASKSIGQMHVALGRFMTRENIPWGGHDMWSLVHDCRFLVGSSGAPIIDLNTWQVVGVQFAGNPGSGESFAVPVSEVARDLRLRNLPLIFSEDTIPRDPLAFASHWPDDVEAFDSIAEKKSAAVASQRNLTDIVEDRLAAEYATVADLEPFFTELGPEYKQAFDSQPGLGRVADAEFRGALVDTLRRRSLLNEEFQSRIGLAEEPEDEAAEETDESEIAGLPQSAILTPATRLSEDEIGALKTHIVESEQDVEALFFGSPFLERLSHEEITAGSLPDIIERLATSQEEIDQQAVIWALRRTKQKPDGEKIAAVYDAFETLGVSPAAPYLESIPFRAPTVSEMVDVSFLKEGLTAARSVCLVRYLPDNSGSTGWLLAPDLVVAPAHILTGRQGRLSRGETGKDVTDDAALLRVEFGDEELGDPRRDVSVASIATWDAKTDQMVLRLAEPLTDRRPLQLQTERVTDGPVSAIHHPNLGKTMLSLHGGRLLSNDGHETRYLLATAPGSAGAPIFDRDWNVIATHHSRMSTKLEGVRDLVYVKLGASVDALVDHLRGSNSGQELWRKVVGAQKYLRSIDPSLVGTDVDDTAEVPVVVALVDEKTALPDIPGLKISRKVGAVVTAVATFAAVRTLLDTMGVVSIDASQSVGRSECVHSLPFIGVPEVRRDWGETGDKAIIAVIDSGIDPFHEAFSDAQGMRSRIDLYWDQCDTRAGPGEPTIAESAETRALVAEYNLTGGALYSGDDIDRLRVNPLQRMRTGVAHGTAVASIAGGRVTGSPPLGFAGGIAPDARLVAVRFDRGGASIGYSKGHIEALALIDAHAEKLGLPVVVNISNGMNSGAHDGSSAVEKQCDLFTSKPGRVVVKSAGNERNTAKHALFELTTPNLSSLEWDSRPKSQSDPQADGKSDFLELWFATHNTYRFEIVTPDQSRSSPILAGRPVNEVLPNRNLIKAKYARYAAENADKSKLSIEISPGDKRRVQPGIWKLTMKAEGAFRGPDKVHGWLELTDTRDLQFKTHANEKHTITVPGTTTGVITVAAIHAVDDIPVFKDGSMGPATNKVAATSGVAKPDIVAPGVGIAAARAGTDRDVMPDPESGTSVAAPHVSGVIALALSRMHKAAAGRDAALKEINQVFIRRLLLNSADDLSVVGDDERGFGRLNANEFFKLIVEHVQSWQTPGPN